MKKKRNKKKKQIHRVFPKKQPKSSKIRNIKY